MTKLTTDRIPSMKAKQKPKKLGIISTKKRQNMTLRISVHTLDKLDTLLNRMHQAINYKICRTDIIEALIHEAQDHRTNTEIKNILLELGKS